MLTTLNRIRRASLIFTVITVIFAVFLSAFFCIGAASAQPLDLSELPGAPGMFVSQPDINVIFNELEMITENALFLSEERLFLPARSFLEALGAVVQWDPQSNVISAFWHDNIIILPQQAQQEQAQPSLQEEIITSKIIAGRAFLPLRYLVESLGGNVYWDHEQRRVEISLEQAPAIPFLKSDIPVEYLSYGPYRGINLLIDSQGVRIGDSAESVLERLGEPLRRDETAYGYQWWVYGSDPLNYVQVGIDSAGDDVVALYIYGEQWSFGPIKAGDKLQKISDHFNFEDNLSGGGRPNPYRNIRPSLLYPGLLATFFHDAVADDVLVALRLEKRETVDEKVNIFFNSRYSVRGRGLADEEMIRRAESTDEQQLFNLVNAARAREGVPPLKWHEGVARAALGHSKEMFLLNYFGHVSPATGKNLPQRLDDEKVNYVLAAETLGKGQLDAIEAFHDLMNSPEHRARCLYESYRFLGVGVYGDSYIQNFISE